MRHDHEHNMPTHYITSPNHERNLMLWMLSALAAVLILGIAVGWLSATQRAASGTCEQTFSADHCAYTLR